MLTKFLLLQHPLSSGKSITTLLQIGLINRATNKDTSKVTRGTNSLILRTWDIRGNPLTWEDSPGIDRQATRWPLRLPQSSNHSQCRQLTIVFVVLYSSNRFNTAAADGRLPSMRIRRQLCKKIGRLHNVCLVHLSLHFHWSILLLGSLLY